MKAIVLLSGGQDSTTTLYWARKEYGEVAALSFDYGQRHAVELEAGEEIARLAGVPRTVVDVRQAFSAVAGSSALIDKARPLTADGGFLDREAPNGLPSSFVPGRNLIFLSVAASFAVSLGAKVVVTGVCQTDFSGYPDCRDSFVKAMEIAATEAMPSSAGPIRIVAPLMFLTKAETVRLGVEVGAMEALARSVTCYEGRRPGCGVCPACVIRARGFAEAGVADPAS